MSFNAANAEPVDLIYITPDNSFDLTHFESPPYLNAPQVITEPFDFNAAYAFLVEKILTILEVNLFLIHISFFITSLPFEPIE